MKATFFTQLLVKRTICKILKVLGSYSSVHELNEIKCIWICTDAMEIMTVYHSVVAKVKNFGHSNIFLTLNDIL